MLPKMTSVIPKQIKFVKRATKTHQMNVTKKEVVGVVDGLEAIKQAIYCILQTERYEYLIYSWNYGVELKDLFGKPLPYVKSETKRRITEALSQDDRVKNVDDFSFLQNKDTLLVKFCVHTMLGDIQTEKEVKI